ncbi:MAG: hypothetical protein RSA53_09090 [Odoribacter sp.]
MKKLEKFTKLFRQVLPTLLLLIVVCLTACDDDPTFPDPGIDMSQSQDVVVCLDTIDRYTLSMNVTTPGGLEVLEILNANDHSVLSDLSEKYKGQTKFLLEYEILLPERDTVLSYNIRIVDAQSKVINKPFNITVKAASKPIIEVFGGLEKSVISPTFLLKAKLSSGVNKMKEYKLTLDRTKVLDSKVFEGDPVDVYDYEFLCELSMKLGEPAILTFDLVDDKDLKSSVDIRVTLVAGNKPIKVVIESYRTQQETVHKFNHIYFVYNDEQLIQKMNYDFYVGEERTTRWQYNITYNDKKKVSKLETITSDSTFYYIQYEYDSDGSFKSSSRYDGPTGETDPKTKLSVLEKDANGFVTSFLRGATAKLENIRYETVGKEKLLVDYFKIMNVKDNFREHFTGNTSVVWPTYFPELPAFFPEVPERRLANMFCYKYIYTDRVSTNGNGKHADPGESMAKYTYNTDAKGRVNMVQIAEPLLYREGFTDYEVYTFEYAD